jgi:hypothetical protein
LRPALEVLPNVGEHDGVLPAPTLKQARLLGAIVLHLEKVGEIGGEPEL